MRDENRIPLFVRVPPSLKDEAAEAAKTAKVSVSRYVEAAIRDRLRQTGTPPEAQ